MLKKLLLMVALVCGVSAPALADPVVGKPAPTFIANDVTGKSVDLTALKGKTVVLEWTNYGCPFVRKHYDSGNMQKLQKDIVAKDVVWLTIMSSAEGKEGFYATDALAAKAAAGKKAASSHLIRDPKGAIGKLYGASTTPHMFVIDPKGVLVYKGAIDDMPSVDPATLKTAKNYVSAAVDEVLSGKTVTTAETQPYGCSVKY